MLKWYAAEDCRETPEYLHCQIKSTNSCRLIQDEDYVRKCYRRDETGATSKRTPEEVQR